MKLVFTVTIPGRAYVKKNGAKVYRNRLIYTPNYRAWREVAQLHIKARSLMHSFAQRPFRGKLRLQVVFYFQNRSSESDLSALYEGIQDELQVMGVIENDKHIFSHDGSTKIFSETERQRTEVSLFTID